MPRRLPRHRRWLPWLLAAVALYIAGRLLWDLWQPATPQRLDEGIYAVRNVVDGDTILLANGARIRLIGVDAPEIFLDDAPPEAWGAEAAEFARQFLLSNQVRLQFDRERVDRYGRFLAYVYVDGDCLNEALIRAGLARARTDFNYAERYRRMFRAAEDEASEARRGIWSGAPSDR